MATARVWSSMEAYWPAAELVRNNERLIPKIEQSYKEAHPSGKGPSSTEVESWRESLYEVATALVDLGLGQVWMFLEYRVGGMDPIDVVLAGRHPVDGLSYAVIE